VVFLVAITPAASPVAAILVAEVADNQHD
jgi:hypothetical protein